ncbi:MAG TPA: MFS transporter [Nakamurella sp.]|nr:MFS transporter [Nakamurella sp.]
MGIENATDPAPALPRQFRQLVVAWAGSLTGDGLRVVALPLLAVSIDPSPAAVAMVAAAATLPWLVVAIPAGALVDRLNPAIAMATAHLARVLLSLAVVAAVLTDTASIALLCVVGFALTSAETFADGSAQTLLLRIVPPEHLERANARFVTVETLALDLAGPLAGGVLFAVAPWLPFAASAGCFVLAAARVIGIRSQRPAAPGVRVGGTTQRSAQATDGGVWGQVRAGLTRLFSDPVLRMLAITVAVMATANAAADAVLVIYGTQTLQMSDALYPTLLVAYSLGTLVAAALVGRLIARLRGGQAMMFALFGISAAMLLLGLVPVVGVAWLAFAVMGLAGGTWNVLSATRRQRRTPHDMIARVSSAFRVVAWGVIPIGATLGGLVGERWGVTTVFTAAGVVIALLGAVVMRSFLTVEPPGAGEQVTE